MLNLTLIVNQLANLSNYVKQPVIKWIPEDLQSPDVCYVAINIKAFRYVSNQNSDLCQKLLKKCKQLIPYLRK